MKGEIAVRYTIRHFDLPLLTFEANMDSADTDLHSSISCWISILTAERHVIICRQIA